MVIYTVTIERGGSMYSEIHDNIYILKLDSVEEARQKLILIKHRLRHDRCHHVIIDLNELQNVDHKMVLLLLEYSKSVHDVNGSLTLVDGDQKLEQLLDMMKLNHYFRVVSTENEAIVHINETIKH